MNNRPHLPDIELIELADGEMDHKTAAVAANHLRTCSACRNRQQELRTASAAYEEFRERVLKPSLDVPVAEWPALGHRLERLEKPRRKLLFAPALVWGAAAALCALLAVVLFYFQHSPQPGARQLLSEAAAVPSSPHSGLVLTAGARSWLRPAVLRPGEAATSVPATDRPGYEHVKALFVEARYSWADPLSARSFAAWRDQLPEKHDRVTLIRGEDGTKRFYRLQTRTSASILRTASLTLHAGTLRTVNAAFEFEGEDDVEMTEQPSVSPETASAAPPNEDNQVVHPKLTETAAGPQDELRVLAALNAIGADVGEPIDVNLDASHRHVLVTGIGMPPGRQREVEQALAKLPNAVVRFDSSAPAPSGAGIPAKPDNYAAGSTSPFRQTLVTRAGGAHAFQVMTDRALDLSSSLFAQASALLVLSKKFSPSVESGFSPADQQTLLALRQGHSAAIVETVQQLSEEVAPLLANAVVPPIEEQRQGISWQERAVDLFAASRNLDQIVSRLLAGSYSDELGEEMLKQLDIDLKKVHTMALPNR